MKSILNHPSAVQLFVVAICVGAMSSFASAAFVLIEDFEGGTVGDKLNTGNWELGGDEVSFFAADPAGGVNQVGAFEGVLNGGNFADLSLGAEAIADGTTGTLFFRLRAAAGSTNHSLGLADQNPSTNFDAFESQLVLSGTAPDVRVRDGGNTDDTTVDLGTNTWRNVWIVADNAADTYEIYLTTGLNTATAADLITAYDADDVDFRSGTSSALSHFFLGTGARNITDGLPVYIDDIYVDNSGANLINPIPEPTSLAVVAMGAIAMFGRRRR